MFALTSGELALVLFLFALVWGAGLLPRFAERAAMRLHRVAHPARPADAILPVQEARTTRSSRDGG